MATPADRLEPLLLTPTEAARLLSIDRSTLHRWSSSGKLGPRPLPIGRGMFSSAELRGWVAGGCVPRSRWCWPPEGGRP